MRKKFSESIEGYPAMAGIKYMLQKEVFESDERILSVCNVTELYKKKKSSYLTIVSATRSRMTQVTLSQVKQYDKGVYKKKRTWTLEEVKVVDGKHDSPETHELDISLEKQYKWFAVNLHERQNFITVLWKQINKHVAGEKAVFKNIPKAWLTEQSPERVVREKSDSVNEEECAEDGEAYEEFHALTDKEEMHLQSLIGECNFAISDAEQFMEQLGRNLQELDGANVQSVLASEKQVNALMEQIETAIAEAERVEERLDAYDEILCHIRDTMEKMGEKNTMIEVANANNIKLMVELERIVSQLDLAHAHQVALTDTDLTSPTGLAAAIAAGRALQTSMNSDIDPALLRLTAVQDQRKRFEKWKAKFSQTISRHLNNMFIHLGNDLGEGQGSEAYLPKHSSVHRELSAYAELMHWLKSMDRKAYDQLAKVYTSSLNKVYDREIRHFFDQARQQVMREDVAASTSATRGKQLLQPYGIIGVNRDLWAPGIEAAERQKLDGILEKVLGDLEPVALSEQLFCISFFQMDVLSPTSRNTQTTLEAVAEREDPAVIVSPPQKKIDRQINEEVRKMMTELFACLEPELNSFIQSFEKVDSL